MDSSISSSRKEKGGLQNVRAFVSRLGFTAYVVVFVRLERAFIEQGLVCSLMTCGACALLLALVLVQKRYRLHYTVILLAGAVFLVFGEVYFRLRYFGTDGVVHFNRHVPAHIGDPLGSLPLDPGTYTGLKPGQAYFKGMPFHVNRLGFRGEERAREKAPGVVRIVVAGGSTAMGAGVAEGRYYSCLLEQMLNEPGARTKFEVLNFCIGGFTATDVTNVLRDCAMDFDPDIVLISSPCLSRILPMRGKLLDRAGNPPDKASLRREFLRSPWRKLFFVNAARRVLIPEIDRRIERQFAALKKLIFRPANSLRPDVMEAERSVAVNEAELSERLKAIRELTRERHAFVVTLPSAVAGPDALATERIQSLCRQHDLGLIETFGEDYGHSYGRLTIYPGDDHPNAAAHRIIADAIFKGLQ